MLNKVYRITKDREFQSIYRRGRYQSTALFSIHFLPNKLELSRVGIVVSKKISKKAVERNRVKRQVREIAREFHKNIKKPVDIVITLKKPALDTNFAKLQQDIQKAMEKLELL